MTTEERLDRIERILDRICRELDVCFRAQQALLVALNAADKAAQLAVEFEQLHEARHVDVSERDTLPPAAEWKEGL